MLSSRNIHFAILGIILGAVSGYIFAFYQFQSTLPPTQAAAPQGGVGADHPEINPEQMLATLKQATEQNPQDANAAGRYANALFNAGRFEEAVSWYGKVLELEPNNLDVRSLRGAVLWRMGRMVEAREDLETAVAQDPNHVPGLHGLALLALDRRDIAEAESLLRRIEQIDPTYGGLGMIRDRLEQERARR